MIKVNLKMNSAYYIKEMLKKNCVSPLRNLSVLMTLTTISRISVKMEGRKI